VETSYSGVEPAKFGLGILVIPQLARCCVVEWITLGGRVCIRLKLDRSLV